VTPLDPGIISGSGLVAPQSFDDYSLAFYRSALGVTTGSVDDVKLAYLRSRTGVPGGSIDDQLAEFKRQGLSYVSGPQPLASETWTGADGAAWPAQWAVQSGTATLVSNAGQLVSGATAYGSAYARLAGLSNIGDTNLSCTFIFRDAGVEQYGSFGIDGDSSTSGINVDGTCYAFILDFAATPASGGLELNKYVAGAETQLTTVTKTLTGGVKYGVRFQRLGTALRARVWDASTSEPATWDITYTITDTPLVGKPSVGFFNGGTAVARQATFDSLTVYAA
jgi:X-X-X-Leu-X-X-Gly heptad repeat protein